MQTLIRKNQFNDADPYARIQGIIDYVNALVNGYYFPEEIDQLVTQASEVYQIDYYLDQIENGGFLQFFLNSNFNPDTNHLIASGLGKMHAVKNRALFEKAMDIFAVNMKKMEAILERGGDVYQEFSPLFNELTDYFFKLNKEESILAKNYEYIATIEGLQILNDAAYDLELRHILDKVPDLLARKADAERYAEENEPPYSKIARIICQTFNYPLLTINTLDYGEDIVSDEEVEENSTNNYMFFHVTTDKGYCYITFDNEHAKLFKGDTHQLIGALDLNSIFDIL